MKIVRLEAENVKRLRAVEIVPDGNTVVISGRNGQGKTSVLDSIWLALGGGPAGRATKRPIRDGEKSASVTLDLGELKVTRSWEGDRTTLRVENAEGARYGSPQSMLDGLVGRLSFDPLTFAQQDERSQRSTLLSLVDLPFDPDELAAERRGAFDARTETNRDLKRLEARIAGIPVLAGVPDEEVDLADLLRQASDARGHLDRAERFQTDLAVARDDVDAAERVLRDAQEALAVAETRVAGIPADLPDPIVFEEQIASADATNRAVRAAQERAVFVGEADTLRAESDRLTGRLQEIDDRRQAGLVAAKMPLDGLAFDEDGVTYQGVPLKQASAAEQLRVSIAMAMALNPKVRVIRITDGSLLDSENLALIAAMVDEHDFQCWIERVDETGQMGVVIEDGSVVVPVVKS